MVVDTDTFYGKRKENTKSILEINVEKYNILKRLKKFEKFNSLGVRKRFFYKQHEALSYYTDLMEAEVGKGKNECTQIEKKEEIETYRSQGAHSHHRNGIIIYTEEMENGKRCFILDTFYNFMKFYSFYALSLQDIYFYNGEKISKKGNFKGEEGEEGEEEETYKSHTNEQEMHLYELIMTNEKRWLFFDLEYDVLKNDENKDCILFIFLIELCLFVYSNFDIKICLNDVIILDSSTCEKISFHVIVKNIHSLDYNYDYYEYLVDYCHFFLNCKNTSDYYFYEKYKQKQIRLNSKTYKKILLLFDNENCIKYFVDMFINHIVQAVQETENAYLINLTTVYIECEKGQNFHNNDISNSCSSYHTEMGNRTCVSNYNKHIGSLILSPTNRNQQINTFLDPMKQNKQNECSLERNNLLDMINDFTEIEDFVKAIGGGEEEVGGGGHTFTNEENKRFNNQDTSYVEERKKSRGLKRERKKESAYFTLYNKTLKDVVSNYINMLKNKKEGDNCEITKYDNYLILLYAKKRDANGEHSTQLCNLHMDMQNNEVNSKYNIPLADDIRDCTPLRNEDNVSNIFRNYDEFFLMNKEKNSHEEKNPYEEKTHEKEMVLLKCIVDNSVYSRNRNFRMIFSSKKKKNNKLLLSKYNVKKHYKSDVDNLILKSLVTFYLNEDTNCQIEEDLIFKNEKIKKKYGENFSISHAALSHTRNVISKRQRNGATTTIIQQHAHTNINLDNINYDHIHNILKIIIFWNFELYKNFKKNKIYVTKFQNEISKEYFYRIVSIHNKLHYHHLYTHRNNEYKSIISDESPEFKNSNTTQKEKFVTVNEKNNTNTDQNNNDIQKISPQNGIISFQTYDNLDIYDNLFLKNEEFYLYVLDEYKKHIKIKKEENHLLFLIKYFIYSITQNSEEYIIYFRDNKYCKNKNLSHKSNHIYIVFNYQKNLFVQKCHDNECSHFVSEIYYL
ncbi:hypothetical protein, conserved [Plasmodium gonderi]|uniref:DNA-directed primase/polymerase protein n=1 Tax=Plasmodium gonderi TaxID=77519 RepID=A0A1Y1JL48_PLAGO|nr:hypothetical protein, conserved [Plasmodium gonderi]GAW83161.1 hypothetical protein, conserved [Plasmodium gonderi]